MSSHLGQASAVRARNQLAPPGQVRQRASPAASTAESLSAFDPYASAPPIGPRRTPARPPVRAHDHSFDDPDGSDPGWGSDASARSDESRGSDSKMRGGRSKARTADPLAGLVDVLDDWDQVARRTQTKLENWFGLPPAPSNGPSSSAVAPTRTTTADPALPKDKDDDQVRVYVHRVQAGDTLAGLAVRYGAPLATLRRCNGLWDRDMVLARPVVYIPLDACTRPAPAGSSQTTLGLSDAREDIPGRLQQKSPQPIGPNSDSATNDRHQIPRTRTPVSPGIEQRGRAALPSPHLEARLAPFPSSNPSATQRGYAPRSSDAFLIDLSDAGNCASSTSTSAHVSPSYVPSPLTNSSKPSPMQQNDTVAAIPAQELSYFPPPLHPTPLYAGTKARTADKGRDTNASRGSLDSLARMSAARSASVLQPPRQHPRTTFGNPPGGPLSSPGGESVTLDSRTGPPLASAGLKPLRLASSASTRSGATVLTESASPRPGVKVNHAYSGPTSASDPDSSTWSALLAGLPPNSGPGAHWARPIGLPVERQGGSSSSGSMPLRPPQAPGAEANIGFRGAQSWSANDWSTLLGDTIRGRVPLDTAFQQAADKVGREFRDWTLEPTATTTTTTTPSVPNASSGPHTSGSFQPPQAIPGRPSRLPPAPARSPSSSHPPPQSRMNGLGNAPPRGGLTSRRSQRSSAGDGIELL